MQGNITLGEKLPFSSKIVELACSSMLSSQFQELTRSLYSCFCWTCASVLYACQLHRKLVAACSAVVVSHLCPLLASKICMLTITYLTTLLYFWQLLINPLVTSWQLLGTLEIHIQRNFFIYTMIFGGEIDTSYRLHNESIIMQCLTQ